MSYPGTQIGLCPEKSAYLLLKISLTMYSVIKSNSTSQTEKKNIGLDHIQVVKLLSLPLTKTIIYYKTDVEVHVI
jgi:hypothetical protein